MLTHAIVGCGRVAPYHADAFARIGALAACADVDLAQAAKLGAQFGVPAISVSEALSSNAITSLSICTPHDLHQCLALEALKHGKHVLIEKPMVMSPSEGEQLLARAGDRGLVVMPVAQHRFDPLVVNVRELVSSGDLGDVRMARAHLECHRSTDYYAASTWRGTWAREGGSALMNQGYHLVDLLLHLCGPLDPHAAAMHRFAGETVMETEDTFAGVLRFRSGAFGVLTITGAGRLTWHTSIELIGTKGEVAFTIDHPSSLERLAMQDGTALELWKHRCTHPPPAPPSGALIDRETAYYGNSHRAQAIAFADWVARGTRPAIGATPEEALATVAAIDGLYSAARRASNVRRPARASNGGPISHWIDEWSDVTPDDVDAVSAQLLDEDISVVSGGVLERFERAFAIFAGQEHAVAVGSGTSAIHAALLSVGVGRDDDVLVCDYSFHAVAAAICAIGARVVPCDCLSAALTLDPADIARKRTPRTRAIVVHAPWGVPPHGPAIRRAAEDLPIIYDGSHAHGAVLDGVSMANHADITCYSLGRRKLVSGGELGCAVTNNVELRDRVLLHAHVNRVPRDLKTLPWQGNAVGLKSRPHVAALSLGLSQLSRAADKLRRSRATGAELEELFEAFDLLRQEVPATATRSYWRIVLHLGPRWDQTEAAVVEGALRAAGVPVENNHYWPLLQHQSIFNWPVHARLVVPSDTPIAHSRVPRTITLPAPVSLKPHAIEHIRSSVSHAFDQALRN